VHGPFEVHLHPEITRDLASIPRNMAGRILTAIDQRLSTDPGRYGERLRKSLRGFWKLRVGDYRVVYAIAGRQVRVFGVMDRKEIYGRVVRRLPSR